MIISLVVAAADNNAIGKNNRLLWSLPNDMKFFKNLTWGMVIIMGRKTLESLGRPLKGRKNIVITGQKNFKVESAVVVKNIEEALSAAKNMDVKEVYVIGGGEIYRQYLPKANRIYITRVHTSPADADTFFPEFNSDEWNLVSQADNEPDVKHAYAYSFQLWERK